MSFSWIQFSIGISQLPIKVLVSAITLTTTSDASLKLSKMTTARIPKGFADQEVLDFLVKNIKRKTGLDITKFSSLQSIYTYCESPFRRKN